MIGDIEICGQSMAEFTITDISNVDVIDDF